jgi:hypothetical protein
MLINRDKKMHSRKSLSSKARKFGLMLSRNFGFVIPDNMVPPSVTKSVPIQLLASIENTSFAIYYLCPEM